MNKRQKYIAWVVLSTIVVLGLESLEPVPGAAPVRAGGASKTPVPWWVTPTLLWGVTPSATPSFTPTPEKMSFTMADFNSVSPGEVLAEMYVYGQGGSGPEQEKCDANPRQNLGSLILMESLRVYLCWPEKYTWLNFIVYRPDGRSEATSLFTQSDGSVYMTYQPLYNYPTGVYTLKLYSSKYQMNFSITYLSPKDARLLEAPYSVFSPTLARRGPSRLLILDHFVPGEKVRLYAYKRAAGKSDLRLIGWQEFIIRGDGSMPVSVYMSEIQQNEYIYFAALGELTGEVHIFEPDIVGRPRDFYDDVNLFCPGAKPSRLKLTVHTARVGYGHGTGLPLRDTPGLSDKVILWIPTGAKVTLISSTRCINKIRYWRIEYENKFGWAPEADANIYLMEPVD